jgi:hypothetical protein
LRIHDDQQQLFYYHDFGFPDEGAQRWAIGQTNGTLLGYAAHDGSIGRQRADTRRGH